MAAGSGQQRVKILKCQKAVEQAEHRLGEVGLELVEDRLAQARRARADDAFEHAADGITAGAGLLDEGDHALVRRRCLPRDSKRRRDAPAPRWSDLLRSHGVRPWVTPCGSGCQSPSHPDAAVPERGAAFSALRGGGRCSTLFPTILIVIGFPHTYRPETPGGPGR